MVTRDASHHKGRARRQPWLIVPDGICTALGGREDPRAIRSRVAFLSCAVVAGLLPEGAQLVRGEIDCRDRGRIIGSQPILQVVSITGRHLPEYKKAPAITGRGFCNEAVTLWFG